MILFESLLAVPHQSHFVFEPSQFGSDDAGHIIDAIGWVLANIASTSEDFLPPFTDVSWPAELVRLGIVESYVNVPPRNKSLTVSWDQLTSGIKADPDDLNKECVIGLSRAMADQYRDLLFRDRKSTAKLVDLIESWEHHYISVFEYTLTVNFKRTTDNERFGFRDVRQEVVSRYAHDQLALHLWTEGRNPKSNAPGWTTDFDLNEYVTLHRIAAANPISIFSFEEARLLYDAEYMIQSPTWTYVLGAIRARHDAEDCIDTELANEIENVILGKHGSLVGPIAEPWRLATVPNDLLERLVRYKLAFSPRRHRPQSANTETLQPSAIEASEGKRKSGRMSKSAPMRNGKERTAPPNKRKKRKGK
ncbi:MAG: hypothetical protein DHS20C16_14810 [Phycisphaerae bacterium]|nr:MAG: hypothetical protein DHS20C16_14810 [Phycisphaerae bacterium]